MTERDEQYVDGLIRQLNEANREAADLRSALATAEAERNIAVNAAASKIPDFDVQAIAVQCAQREGADRRAVAAERAVRHEQKLAHDRLRALWRAVHDRNDAPDGWLISEDELICAVQDMHGPGQCDAEAALAAVREWAEGDYGGAKRPIDIWPGLAAALAAVPQGQGARADLRMTPEQVERMCHWVQDREGCQEFWSHVAWHHGDEDEQTGWCPYFAVAEVMRGHADPREGRTAASLPVSPEPATNPEEKP